VWKIRHTISLVAMMVHEKRGFVCFCYFLHFFLC
jgi:hypothetical protein